MSSGAHTLTVAFDAGALTSPAGGVRRYASELFGALAGRDDVDVVAVAPAAGAVLPAGVRAHRARVTAPTNLGRAAVTLPVSLASCRRDVFHAPAYTAPLWQGQPLVLTIHDVVYARHPEWYPGELDPIRQWFYRRSARRARRIVTDSAFSRSEIAAAYGVPVARIDVVPLAASTVFSPGRGVRRGGVLHVGDLHVRRNLPLLLDVILQLRREAVVADVTLTLAGVDRGVLPALRRQAAEAGDPEALVYAGVISDEALVEQYRSAAVFAYPSRYEGFGVPLLEAMQCGTPVVGSRAASIPEVVGTAGLLVDPDDRRGWVEAIRAILTGAARAAEMGDAGLARAAGFTWAATAAATTDVYRRAIAGRN